MSIRNKQAQADRILKLLEFYSGSQTHEWVALPQILALHIASHTRRISDLRKQGHIIECLKEWVDGQVRTKYRLVKKAEAA